MLREPQASAYTGGDDHTGCGAPLSDGRRDGGEGEAFSPVQRPAVSAPEVVSRLGGPVFVDMRPGHVRATCKGVTGVGPDRATAFRALADQFDARAGS